MSILVRGISMPELGEKIIVLTSSGYVEDVSGQVIDGVEAVPVPPHGDLIDRKPFVEFIKTHWDSYDQWFVEQLEARPTIIPADPAEEGET